MSDRKLTEAELEALAHGRRDLVAEDARGRNDDDLVALLESERAFSDDASVALKRAAPDLEDLDAMVSLAMAKLPEASPAHEAPSRRSLVIGAVSGASIALASGVLSIAMSDPRALASDAWGDLTAGTRLAITLATSIDRLVALVPGGWATIAIAGLALVAALLVPLRVMAGPLLRRTSASAAALALAVLATSATARAYEIEGEWPAGDARVSVDVDRTPLSEALRSALASAEMGLAYTLPDDPVVSLHVRDVPLREVLDALLSDVPARVRHTGHLIVIRPEGADAPGRDTGANVAPTSAGFPPPPFPVPPLPPLSHGAPALPPAPHGVAALPALPRLPEAPDPYDVPAPDSRPGSIRDLVTFGGDARVRPDQQVRDVITMGGDATIEGRAYGNVLTMGGDAVVGGTVVGDVVTMGGDIRVARDGRVHGELNAMGGDISVEEPARHAGTSIRIASGSMDASSFGEEERRDRRPGWINETLDAAMRHALLFLLGLLLMGLAPARMSTLQGQIVAQPLRALASGFLGVVAGAVLTIVLVITIVGIPGAVVLALGLFLAAYLGLATAASVLGAALPIAALKDRPVVQLGVGILLLFVVSRVPVIGDLLVVGATLAGLGSVLLTRFGEKLATGVAPSA